MAWPRLGTGAGAGAMASIMSGAVGELELQLTISTSSDVLDFLFLNLQDLDFLFPSLSFSSDLLHCVPHGVSFLQILRQQ